MNRNKGRTGIRKFIARMLPNHLIDVLLFEIHMAMVRVKSWNTSRNYRASSGLLLNIGAGGAGRSGWINVDGFMNQGVNCVFDVRKRLPFSDGSAKGIFLEHFFEHIDYLEEVPFFLSECNRVLQDNGVIRIIVPDAEKYLIAYARGGWQELSTIRPLKAGHRDHYFHFKYNTRMELINVIFRQGQEHKFAYDYETLEYVLGAHGFSNITKQTYGVSIDPALAIDNEDRASESLYVEAVKKANS